ncbi:MotA/TolQ/ExbB proton channel family protein [Selenomonadales bacterium OttesenSCG-928-I06]|nr:MotA/TolQ/ExbB proton channel family protein [Selenomonadales bacterium OttesenSCG-928-I06]
MDFIKEYFFIFKAGGPVMYLILLCSIIVIAIAVERYNYYKNVKVNDLVFVEEVKYLIKTNQLDLAEKMCEGNKNIVASVIYTTISTMKNNYNMYKEVFESQAAISIAKLRENLTHLETIVTIAPLLGLLGTVIGMIQAFNIMNVKSGEPLKIADGVAEALIATAFGLCVAVLAMFFYSYFNHKVDKVITLLEEVGIVFINKPVKEDDYETK